MSTRHLLALATLLAGVMPISRAAAAGVNACADVAERGQVLRDDHKLLEAREAFVSCAQRECPAVVRDSCVAWLNDVDRLLPSILVSAKTGDGHDIAGLRVAVDGAPAPSRIAVTATSLDPGVHTVRCEAAGFVPVEESIVLREGEARRVVSFVLTPKAPVTVTVPEAGRLTSPWVYGLGGLALLGFGTFAVAAATGAGEYNRLDCECGPSCPSGDLDALRTRFVVADVGLVVGLLSLGGALTIAWLTRPSAQTSAAVR